jgi:hypothetical protein
MTIRWTHNILRREGQYGCLLLVLYSNTSRHFSCSNKWTQITCLYIFFNDLPRGVTWHFEKCRSYGRLCAKNIILLLVYLLVLVCELLITVRILITLRFRFSISVRYKGKTIPLKTWTGPEGSRSLRLPDFKTFDSWRCLGCQPYVPAGSTPQEIFLVLISVRG